MKFKKGDATYFKCVGYGLVSYEEGPVVLSVRAGKIRLKDRDYPFDAETGIQICDLPSLGLTVSLCVTEEEIRNAKEYCEVNI